MSDPTETSVPPPPPPLAGGPAAPGEPAPGTLPEASWTPARALLGLVALLVAVALSAIPVAALDPDIESLGARLTLQVLLAAAMIGVAFSIANPGRPGLIPAAALGFRRPHPGFIKPSLLAYLVYIGSAIAIGALLQPEQEDVTRELGVDEGALGAIIAGVLIIGAAPLSEEIFFRGFMFAGLRRSGFWVGALISSAVWGLFHYTGPDTWGVCLQLTIFGVILCWLYQRTGSLWPPIAVHAFNNALAFTLLTST